MELLQAFAIIVVLVAPFIALFVTGHLAQPAARRPGLRDLTTRGVWSAVRRGNAVLAPTVPYRDFARRS